ncbi:MAG TPA: DUF192 domain-containing protein [Stellaceae bacterium]|nr:DUF192 domain-containing protein [Stellaceae bacterium]
MFLRSSLIVAALLSLLAVAARADLASFDKSSITLDTAAGPQRFSVELALTPQQQEQGLMYRRALPADGGMLFVFPADQTATFWMRNTLIPLDMLFIAADGRIADIHERAVPLSEATISSKVPVRAVLEVNGGTVRRLAIKRGDVVHSAVFGNAGG